jgi:hypothetical protein
MFDLSPAKRLLVLLCTVTTGHAAVLCVAIVLSRDPAPAVAAPVPVAAGRAVSPSDPMQRQYEQQVKPLLVKYCYSCHADGKDKGDLTLDEAKTVLNVQRDRNTWQKVADNTLTGAMPPKNKTQPTAAERKLVSDWIAGAFEWFDPTAPRDPGRVTIRRLNRNEYNNTVRDLLGVTFKPAADFPADDTGYGFDNIGDVLSMSPLHAEKYLAAAEDVVDRSLAPPHPPEVKIIRYRGGELQATEGGLEDGVRTLTTDGEVFKGGWPFPVVGQYEIRVRASADRAGDEFAKLAIRFDNKDVKVVDVKDPPPKKRWNEYSVRVDVIKPGAFKVAAAFTNDFYDPDATDPKRRDRNLRVHLIEVAGPFNAKPVEPSKAYKKVFFVRPGPGVTEEQAAFKVLQRFCTRAYRRPATAREIEQLLALYKIARADGNDFEAATKIAITATLVSPNFLFRIEQEKSTNPDQPYLIGEYELATRLAYFLWSSMPDDELMAKAGAGQLRKPEVIQAQLTRMLRDPRAKAFVSNFVGQWLELRNIESATIDRKVFPTFDNKLRADMRRETEMFFENLLTQDRSVLDLLAGDYTFVNERLAKHYGIAGVAGEDFRQVSLAGTRRGGVLTMAGVLTVTAMPTRTSPVKRGKFVLEQILGTPPPPAPADVPALSEKPADVSAKPLRDRLQAHRADAACASCHARMDPIGFAMENFDAIGRWRDKDGSFPIDASGTLPEGQSFKGPDELRRVIAARKDDFLRTLTEKMMTYALGRGMETYDKSTIRDIGAAVAKDGYKFSTLISRIVNSDAFQKRRAKRGEE